MEKGIGVILNLTKGEKQVQAKNIDFFCNDENTVKYFPPVPAKKMTPDWYKTMSRYIENKRTAPTAKDRFLAGATDETFMTIKSCIPVQDYITGGYILRAPDDVLISPSKTEEGLTTFFWWTRGDSKPSHHGHAQCPVEIKGSKNIYIKLMNPWTVKTPPGYSCLFYQPEFFFEERFKLFPGIVDTDKYEHAVNFPGVVMSSEEFKLEAGTPLMVVFPFKRETWASRISVKPQKKMPGNFIEQMYLKLFHSAKSYD